MNICYRGRREHGAAVIEDQLLVFGGFGAENLEKSIELRDAGTGAWREAEFKLKYSTAGQSYVNVPKSLLNCS
jgi:hypothetical protein